jgi:hypothetical protein
MARVILDDSKIPLCKMASLACYGWLRLKLGDNTKDDSFLGMEYHFLL